MWQTLRLTEPDINVVTGDTVADAATLYIESAPSEGTNDYALFVDSGTSRFDGDVGIGVTTPADELDIKSTDARAMN